MLQKKIMYTFLNVHYRNINSIADIIRTQYKPNSKGPYTLIIHHVNKDVKYFNKISSDKVGDKKQALINLRNAWYNECAFLNPSKYGVESAKFIPWNIIQFYYTIFTGLSSIVRCIDSDESLKGHKKMINFFTNRMLNKKGLCKDIFVPPFCFVLNQKGDIYPSFEDAIKWEYGLEYKCPKIKECLKNLNIKGKASLFHYFYELRNWANYEDSYIFRRLYGESVRPRFYWDMYWIISAFLSVTEIFLMWVFGADKIIEEKDLFIDEFNRYFESDVEDENRVTRNLKERFNYYNNFLTTTLL